MSSELYHQLGFEKVRQYLARHTHTERARLRCVNLESFQDQNIYREQQRLVLEMRDLVALDSALPLMEFDNMSDILRRSAIRDAALNTEELHTIGSLLQAKRHIDIFFRERNRYARLKQLVENNSHPLRPLEDSILSIFDAAGQVADNASPELSSLRRKIRKTEQHMQTQIQKIAAEAAEENVSAIPQVAYRGGRLVIPVRASRKNAIPGIIHDQSQTGQTYYIEPMIIVSMNNNLRELQIAEADEIHRILKEKTAEIRDQLFAVEDAVYLLEELDFLHTKGKLASDYRCEMPEEAGKTLFIKNGKNLELAFQRDVVPLNLRLTENRHGVIITGPNAGGKTVTLKTIGLIALMNQAGLLIPAESISTLPDYDQIFVDIGDNQSIDGDLSTFSSHILTLKNILENASRDSLILLDELGTGTDPDEGAALAEGVLNYLIRQKTTVIATTHHSALKTLAFEMPELENASMSFNDRTLRPSYEFRQGIPGSSYAIEIAQRFELLPDVISFARERAGQSKQKLERLITDLQRKISRHNELLKETKIRERDLYSEQKEIAEKRKEIDQKYKRAEKDAYKRGELILQEMQKELAAAVKDIRENQASTASIKRAHSVIRKLEEEVETAEKKLRKEEETQHLHFDQLKKGQRVWITHLELNGTILEVNSKTKRVWIDANGSRMRLDTRWLAPAKLETQQVNTFIESPGGEINLRLDLRGFRGDEALIETDKFIDRASRSGMPFVEILHGTGSGILRTRIHDMLKHDTRIKSYDIAPLEQGGYGITIVKL